jgi:NAD(P)-dependent dehydrogenase (short-subunit alcohol dehydrogenase family)
LIDAQGVDVLTFVTDVSKAEQVDALAAAAMERFGAVHIVNTASMLGILPAFGGPYDASKHAVVALTEGLYHTVNSAGLPIGVSGLCPGWVRTGILDSERNWPSEFGQVPERDAAAEITTNHVKRAIAEGAQPGAVADLVVDSIRNERVWVFPSPEFLEVAVERFHTIEDGLNPVPAENIPGMPPRSQMLDEVMTAMMPPTD